MKVGSLLIDMAADLARLRSDLNGAVNSVDSAMRQIGQRVERMKADLGKLAAAFVTGVGAAKMLGAAEQWTTLNNRLKLVTSGAEAFAAAQRNVIDIASATRQPLVATAELYQRVAMNQKELGLSGQAMAEIVKTISQTMIISGANAQSSAAALVQLGQAFASGVLRGEELNSVMEQAPALAQAIAAGMGKTVGELRALGKEGKLTASAVIDALQKQAAAVETQFSTMAPTVGQAMTTLNNKFVEMVGRLDTATGFTQALGGAIVGLAGNLSTIGLLLTTGAVAIGLAALVVNFGALISVIGAANTAMWSFLAAMGPIGWAVTAVIALTAAYVAFRSEIEGTGTEAMTLGSMFSAAWAMATGGADAATEATKKAGDESGTTAKNTVGYWERAIVAVAGLMDTFGNTMVGVGAGIGGVMVATSQVVRNAFKSAFNAIAETAENTLNALIDKYNSMPFLPGKLGRFSAPRATISGATSASDISDAFGRGLAGADSTYFSDKAGEFIALAKAKTALDEVDKAAKRAGKSGQEAGKKIKDEFAALMAQLTGKELGLDADFFDKLNILFDGYKKGRVDLEGYRKAVEALTNSQQFAKDAAAKLAEVDKARAAQIEAFEKTNKDQIKTAADVLANIKFETAALKMTNAERVKAVALRDLERQGIEAGTEAYEQYAQAILTALDEKTVTEASIEAQNKIKEEWQKTTDQMGQSLADALMNGGKSIAEYLKGLFRNLILRPIIQPIATSLAGGFMSMFGGPAMAGQGGIGGSSALGMAGNLGSSLFGGTSFANAIGVGVGNAMSSMGITDGISGLLATNGAYGTAGGLMGAIGPALPFIGIGAMLLSTFWDDLFGKSLRDTGIQGSFSSAGFKGQTYQDYEGGIFSSDSFDTQDLPEQIARPMSEAWKKITKDVTHYADVLGLQSDKIAGFAHEFKLSLGDSELEGDALNKAINDKLQEALKSGSNALAQELIGSWTETMERVTRTTLAGPGLGGEGGDGGWTTTYEEDVKRRTYKPSEFAREGEDAITTLTRLATSLQGVNAIFDTLGLTMYEASLKGGDMASQLADAAGGLDKLQASSASYFQNFYTGSEQHATALRQVREQFDELDVAMPRSRQEFRALVESLDLTTEAGRALYAGLLGISDAFAAVTPNLFGAAQTMTDAITQGMLGTFDGGNLGAYMAQTVSDGIYNAVAGYFAQQVTDILVSGVINPVIQAAITGSTVSGAVSQASIAASIDAANAAMAAMAAIVNDPAFQELMGQITGAVGAIKVPTITRATASVQSYTSAVSASGSAAGSAADEAQRAAKQIKKAWQSIGDSLMDEVNRIRGVMNESAGQGVDYWQAQLAIATAQARAGDQDAAKSLSGISQNLLRAGEESAGSLLELQRLRAQVAQSLQDTAQYAYVQGGVVAAAPKAPPIGTDTGPWTPTRPTVSMPTFTVPPMPPAGSSNAELLAELRALRTAIETNGRNDQDLQRRSVRVLERMDTLGMPAERTEA